MYFANFPQHFARTKRAGTRRLCVDTARDSLVRPAFQCAYTSG